MGTARGRPRLADGRAIFHTRCENDQSRAAVVFDEQIDRSIPRKAVAP